MDPLHATARIGRRALVGAASALAAFGRHERARAQATQTVRFGFWGDESALETYRAIADVFEAIHPEIAIELVYTPATDGELAAEQHEDPANADEEHQPAADEDYLSELAASFAAGNPPDVFLINNRRFGRYAARGELSPVGPRLRQSTTLRAEDFYAQSLDAFEARGEVQCLPQNVSPYVVYVNRTLFAEAGVSLPPDDWTWDDLLATAKALTRDLDGDGVPDQFGLGFDPDIMHYLPFIWQAGGDIVDTDRATLDDPATRAAIEFVVELQMLHQATPGESIAGRRHVSDFLDNRLCMLIDERGVVPVLRGAVGFTWDVAPLPAGPGGSATLFDSDGLCLAASSDVKDAAWAFAEYAASAESQQLLAATRATMPSLRALAESDVFLGQPVDASAVDTVDPSRLPTRGDVYLSAMTSARRVPPISTWADIERAFETPFRRAYYAEMTIDAAIAEAQKRSAPAFSEAAGGR